MNISTVYERKKYSALERMSFQPDFVPQSEGNRSNTWRNVLASVITLVGIVLFSQSLAHRIVDDTQSVAQLATEIPIAVVSGVNSGVGGDVSVPPQHEEKVHIPRLIGEMPAATSFSAESMLVKDHDSGLVLYQKNEYQQHAIASITKLMAALVFLETQPQWESTATVVSDAVLDTHMYAGDMYTIRDLWNAALVGSSNKAILTLADASGWERVAFVERMNEKAKELGMGDTVFVEPTGLSEQNVSTASDLVMLLREALAHPQIRDALLTKEHSLYSAERNKRHHMWNTNWLLLQWIPHTFLDIYGGKTGYIAASGYNFVTQIIGEGNRRLDVVVLGADSHEARFTEARDIALWALDHYQWPDETTQ